MGGESITPTRRALAETIATLQTELSMLTDRFAGGGRGGSSEDLALFLKLSATISELMQSAGLAPSLQPIANHAGDFDREKLTAILNNHIRAREQDESVGIFHDSEGNKITDPRRLAIEQQIYALKQQRDALDATPQPAPASASAPQPSNKVPLPPAAPALTIAGGTDVDAARAEPDTTQRFYEWSGRGPP